MFKLLDRLLSKEAAFIARMLLALLWLGVLAVFLTLTSGCSLLVPRLGPEIAASVNRYCSYPLAERALLRQSINAQIAPHRLELLCSAPAPSTRSPDD